MDVYLSHQFHYIHGSHLISVSCPVCGLSLREGAMNDHLDLCLGGEEKKSALRKYVVDKV